MSIEEAMLRLQRDNKGKANEAANLRSQLEDNKAEIEDLSDKQRKAEEIIDALND